MSNIKAHPTIVKNIEAVLPLGAVLTEIVSTGVDTGEIRYKDSTGKEAKTAVSKASPMIGLGSRVLRYPAKQGERIQGIVENFCTQYKLLMLPGVDYEVGDRTVDFDGEPQCTEVIQILPDSPFLNGTLTLILVDTAVKCEVACLDPNEPAGRDVYILLSKPFEVAEDILVEDKLSDSVVELICDHAKSCGGFVALTREVLAAGTATPLSSDGVSQYTCVSTELGNFGIRFKSK